MANQVRLSADEHAFCTTQTTASSAGELAKLLDPLPPDPASVVRVVAGLVIHPLALARGATHPYRGTGITVPTLAEVLEQFPRIPLLIEIKTKAASRATRDLIERYEAQARCAVAAFDEEAMTPFHGSGIAQGGSRRDTASLLWRAVLRLPVRSPGFSVLCMPPSHRGLPLPVAGYVNILEPLGIPVHCWTIDDIDEARRLRRLGVRGIISNDPAAIRRGLQ